jgi:cellulose synthase/poly-beta-1,6-N-acetylglucosamine synthase-like glycosyltransferase
MQPKTLPFRPTADSGTPREIAFLDLYGAPAGDLARAAAQAVALGVDPDVALLGDGLVDEDFFYRALAHRLGAPFHIGPAPLDPATSPARAIALGLVYLTRLTPYRAIAAPRGKALRFFLDAAKAGRAIEGLAITSPRRLDALVRLECGAEVAARAAHGLESLDASLTARGELAPAQTLAAAGFGLGMIALGATAPWAGRAVTSLLLWGLFTSAVSLRFAVTVAGGAAPVAAALEDVYLPTYTVLIALYREAAVVPKLVAAIERLDYPTCKLDVKLVIEADDKETIAVLAAQPLGPRFDVIVAPPGRPRTKPRALNVALEAARGELVCVFDAEDEPAPDQLRRAAAAFAADPEMDAMQGRLTIGNWRESWLSFMFAVEYAALFELVNPGLSALGLPVALGGTTNHFRTAALRRVGGWDAWNVAEDADLGVRLARFGCRVGALDSETIEEAPTEFGNWFRQRTRWQKGWMQTMIVHTRQPARFFREMGFWRGVAALTLIGGTVATGLVGPPFLFAALWRGAAQTLDETPVSRLADVYTYILTLTGLEAMAVPALVAMRRRGLRAYGRALIGMPLYYALISAATWMALFELIVRPFHWHKTTHGHARPRIAAPRRP